MSRDIIRQTIDFADELMKEFKGDALLISQRQMATADEEDTKVVWAIVHEHLRLMLNDSREEAG
jgi:hypothetical protein